MEKSVAFGLLSHVAILAGFGGKALILTRTALASQTYFEKVIRVGAASTGLMLWGALRGLEISYSNMIIDTVQRERTALFVILGVIFPVAAGVLLTRLCLRVLKQSSNIALRIFILIGVFSLMEFTELYLRAALMRGLPMSRVLVPNILLTMTITLYVALTHDPESKLSR